MLSADSIYTNFPFVTPPQMKKDFSKIGLAERYDWKRPVAVKPAVAITSCATIAVAVDSPIFKSDVASNAKKVLPGSA